MTIYKEAAHLQPLRSRALERLVNALASTIVSRRYYFARSSVSMELPPRSIFRIPENPPRRLNRISVGFPCGFYCGSSLLFTRLRPRSFQRVFTSGKSGLHRRSVRIHGSHKGAIAFLNGCLNAGNVNCGSWRCRGCALG